MSGQFNECGAPINLTASGALGIGPRNLIGFYVNSTSSGTIAFTDGGSGGTAISGTITPAVGWHRFPAAFRTALGGYATIGATLNVTFFVQ